MFVVTNEFVSPSDFTVLLSIYLLVGMAIGGSGTLIGPILGAFFLIYAPKGIGEIGASPLLTPIIYGAALILMLLVMPSGIGGMLQKLGRRLSGASAHPSRRGRSGPPDPTPLGTGTPPLDDIPVSAPAATPDEEPQSTRR